MKKDRNSRTDRMDNKKFEKPYPPKRPSSVEASIAPTSWTTSSIPVDDHSKTVQGLAERIEQMTLKNAGTEETEQHASDESKKLLQPKLAPGTIDDLGIMAGDVHANQHSHEEKVAADLKEKALSIKNRIAIISMQNDGEEESYNYCLEQAYEELDEIIFAIDYYERASEIHEQTAADDSATELADIYYKVGVVHFQQKNFDQSLEYMLKALAIYQQNEPDSTDLASAYHELGRIHEELDHLDQARDWFEKALPILKEQAPYSSILADSYFYLGVVSLKQDQLEKSLHFYQQALTIYEEFLPDSLALVATYRGIALVQEMLQTKQSQI